MSKTEERQRRGALARVRGLEAPALKGRGRHQLPGFLVSPGAGAPVLKTGAILAAGAAAAPSSPRLPGGSLRDRRRGVPFSRASTGWRSFAREVCLAIVRTIEGCLVGAMCSVFEESPLGWAADEVRWVQGRCVRPQLSGHGFCLSHGAAFRVMLEGSGAPWSGVSVDPEVRRTGGGLA